MMIIPLTFMSKIMLLITIINCDNNNNIIIIIINNINILLQKVREKKHVFYVQFILK